MVPAIDTGATYVKIAAAEENAQRKAPAALYARFSFRGEADFQNRLLSAMRCGFSGHLEKSAK
jgi:6-phosphogluconate dehydrogenase